jgi:hypothetical protein
MKRNLRNVVAEKERCRLAQLQALHLRSRDWAGAPEARRDRKSSGRGERRLAASRQGGNR